MQNGRRTAANHEVAKHTYLLSGDISIQTAFSASESYFCPGGSRSDLAAANPQQPSHGVCLCFKHVRTNNLRLACQWTWFRLCLTASQACARFFASAFFCSYCSTCHVCICACSSCLSTNPGMTRHPTLSHFRSVRSHPADLLTRSAPVQLLPRLFIKLPTGSLAS